MRCWHTGDSYEGRLGGRIRAALELAQAKTWSCVVEKRHGEPVKRSIGGLVLEPEECFYMFRGVNVQNEIPSSSPSAKYDGTEDEPRLSAVSGFIMFRSDD